MMRLVAVILFLVLNSWSLSAFTADSVAQTSKEDIVKVGTELPDFKFRDINNKWFSLKELKGKYVLIDVWATWCLPCITQMKYLKILEEQMIRGKRKITFVSLSCDEDRITWANYVKKYNLQGIQIQMDGNNKFSDFFKITSIPRFILLDKKGRVVDANFSRPSEEGTQKRILELKGI